ncbi:SH3 domain-containing protein [Streptomyces sp. NPDC006733]|uniref:SH3 domain-containing protein n=1 Tax=Streptomyces sp. NPDC006733 TaxID=3155460 RepID=UPI00340CD620
MATAGVIAALAGTGILAGVGSAAAAAPAATSTVARSHQDVAKAAEPRGKIVANGGLWVRQEATTTSKRLNLLPQGAVVALQCKKVGQTVDGNKLWYRLGAGKPGWVAARYVQNLSAVPYCK